MAYFLGSGFMTTATATIAWSWKFWLTAAAVQPPQSTTSHAVGQGRDRNLMCGSYGMDNTFTFFQESQVQQNPEVNGILSRLKTRHKHS